MFHRSRHGFSINKQKWFEINSKEYMIYKNNKTKSDTMQACLIACEWESGFIDSLA